MYMPYCTPTRTPHTMTLVRGASDDLHARHTRMTHLIGASADLHARHTHMTHILCTIAPYTHTAYHTNFFCTSAIMPHLDIDVDTDVDLVATPMPDLMATITAALMATVAHAEPCADPRVSQHAAALSHIFPGPATPATTWPPPCRTSWPPSPPASWPPSPPASWPSSPMPIPAPTPVSTSMPLH